jgi:sensor histidine kinase YesM
MSETATKQSAAARLKEMYAWPSSKGLLLITVAITVIVSSFQIRLDLVGMLTEIATNFITCLAISFSIGTVMALYCPDSTTGRRNVLVLLLLLAVGGMVGGLISWGVNDLLFPTYRITHPFLYLAIVALLSIIFGLAAIAYENVSARLEATAARLAEKEVAEQTLLRLKTEAELEALRARVNPHFLFNTLNSIASLIPEDPARAEEMVQRLSNLFHYVLSASESTVVSLEEELRFTGEYLAIEKVRLGERLEYGIESDPSLAGAAIPGMLLQPLVENAVAYGIAPRSDGGRVDVRCTREGERCTITVADTGKGFDERSTEEGFGISGVRRRLELNYPGDHSFDIASDGGVVVRIDIPVRNDLQDPSGG